jgi:hypothetical protein
MEGVVAVGMRCVEESRPRAGGCDLLKRGAVPALMVLLTVVLVAGSLVGVGCSEDESTPTEVSTLLATTTTAATEDGAGVTASEPSSVGDALMAAIARDFAAPGLEFTLDRWTVVDGWAGAIVRPADPTMEGAAVLLQGGGDTWLVVDGGTGYSRDDWIASGAPPELADWFGQ